MTTSRIRQLDAWRGIAASVVFFHHLFVSFQAPFESLRLHSQSAYQVAWFLSELNVAAVLLFFVISGFSIHLSAHQLNMERADDINAYIYRRLKRLLPLYYVALALTLVVGLSSGSSSHDYSARVLIGNLLFLQTPASDRGNWFVPYGGNYPLWSLSFEMFFYACYPLISRYLGRRNGSRDFIGYGSVIALGFSIFGLVVYNLLPNPLALFTSHFVVWYAGVVLAEAYLVKSDLRFAFGVVAALSGGVSLASSIVDSTIISLIRTGMLIALAWIALLILPPVLKSTLKAAANPIVVVFAPVGFCSYAIYLFHQPLIHFFKHLEIGQSTSLIVVPLVCLTLAASAEYLAGLPRYAWLKRSYLPT